MTHNEVVTKLSIELCELLDLPFENYKTVYRYIAMAVTAGGESFGRLGKPVIQYDLKGNKIRTFKDISEASRVIGICRSHITESIRGTNRHKTAGGFIWKYLKNEKNNITIVDVLDTVELFNSP
jgi:hypothetical protein